MINSLQIFYMLKANRNEKQIIVSAFRRNYFFIVNKFLVKLFFVFYSKFFITTSLFFCSINLHELVFEFLLFVYIIIASM